jgi:hypothetical protein
MSLPQTAKSNWHPECAVIVQSDCRQIELAICPPRPPRQPASLTAWRNLGEVKHFWLQGGVRSFTFL